MMKTEQVKYGRLEWTNIENPTHEFLLELEKKHGFHELDLEDCLSKTESPKIEEHKDYVFIVFHFPIRNIKTGYFVVESLNVFISQKYLITMSRGRLKKLDEVFEDMTSDVKERRRVMKQGSGYLLYELMYELFESCMPYLTQLSRFIHEIEDDIFEGKVAKDRLYDVMKVKRKLITLKRTILPHETIIEEIEHLHKRFMKKELEVYFDDIADKIARAKNHLNSMTEMINTLHEANESLTSHNTNRVIKVLTVFSVMMLPITFITGLYGMNVALPIQGEAMAFWQLLAGMGGVLVLMMVVFRWMRVI
ncbi:MAG: magnesium transporter CorA family protein [Candidatus Gracilibacteria bacterium]|nr:magnesium transporter CorA family protein [Candidatus Gracilibacteria bacterium]